MIFKQLILCLFLFSNFVVNAHEGHDSAMAKSLYGGIVKKTLNSYVEVLKDESVEIYISTHGYKNMISPKLSVNAIAEVKGRSIPLKLELKKTSYVVTTDLSKEKHFKLKIILKINGKDEIVVFPLENN